MSFYDRKVERRNIDNFLSKCSDNPCSKIICIEGDIGTGKTEFMKYIIKRNIDCAFSIGNQTIYKCDSIYANNDFSYISDIIYEIYRQNIVFFEKHIEKYFSVNNHTTLLETICSLMPQIKMFSFAKGLLEKKANELSSFKSCITDKILNNQLVDFFAELIFSYLLEKVDETEIFFCVDDIQWLDISSKNTLQTLITKAKLSQSISISLIVTVRSKHILSQLEKENYNYQNHLLVSGQDIEEVPALMCYIQLSLLGIAGYFKVGNSLIKPMTMADDLKNYWFTPIYFSDVWTMRRLFHSI